MERLMVRRTKRLWRREEKRSICAPVAAPGVLVAQVARRYAVNANIIFKWLRDPRYALDDVPAVEPSAADAACFLSVEVVDRPRNDDTPPAPTPAPGMIEIDIAGSHRLRINGAYDPDTLARLIRDLSV
jgi:transposase